MKKKFYLQDFFLADNFIFPPLIIQKGTTQKRKQTRTFFQTTEKLQIFFLHLTVHFKMSVAIYTHRTNHHPPVLTDLNFPFSFSTKRRSNPNVWKFQAPFGPIPFDTTETV